MENIKAKSIFAILIILLMPFLTSSSVSAADGDLDINVDALYDDGQNSQNGQQDYEVPDLFLKDKTRSDQKNKQQKNQLIRKAERSVFLSTKKEKLGHDQKLLRQYLFTAKFSGTKSVGIDNNSSGQDQADLKILLINILLFLALGAGIWLGIKFPSFFRKLKVRRDEGVNDRQ